MTAGLFKTTSCDTCTSGVTRRERPALFHPTPATVGGFVTADACTEHSPGTEPSVCIEQGIGRLSFLHPLEFATVLVLSFKVGERLFIGDNIVVMVLEITGKVARLGVEAPRKIPVDRESVRRDVERAGRRKAVAA